MTHTRTRAGFFERTSIHTASVWLSYAGTNQDFYLTLPINKLDHYVKDAQKWNVGTMYGMGVIKEIDENDGTHAFEAVIEGRHALLVMRRDDIVKYSNTTEQVSV